MKYRFVIWLLIAAVCALGAGSRYQSGWLQTDILALASDTSASPAVAAAQKKLNGQLQRELLWMLVAPAGDGERLAENTETLAQKLQASPAIEKIEYRWAGGERYREEWTLLFPARQQLLSRGDRSLLTESPEQLVQRQLGAIYGPEAGGRLDLERDPLAVFNRYFVAGAAVEASVYREIPVQRSGAREFTLIRATAEPARLNGEIRTPLLDLRRELNSWAEERGFELQVAGAPLHTEYAAAGAQREIRLIGGLSVAAICLLSLWVFRSARPLLLSVFAIGCGIASGTAAVIALLGQIHILAFVFGTTVTGLAIDYAFHFICNRLRPGPARDGDVLPGLLLGLLSSCLAFFALALTPFPLLRQMGLFVGFGLLGAWLTVILLFPESLRLRQKPIELLEYLPRLSRRWYSGALVSLLLVGVAALGQIRFADDLRLFYSPPKFLAADERALNRLLPSRPESRYFLVQGQDSDQVLRREWQLTGKLRPLVQKGQLQRYQALSEKLPPKEIQRADWTRLNRLYGGKTVQGFYTQLGYSPSEARALTAGLQQPFRQISLADWLRVAGPEYRDLWLGCGDHGCASIVRLFAVADDAVLENVAAEGAILVDPPRAVSRVLSQQRDLLLRLLPLVVAIAYLVIALRAGFVRALGIIGLPAAALAGSMAAVTVSGAGVNLFHMAALLLIFGIGVDYAVFSHLSRQPEKSYTLLAIAMAGATTLLGFGLLALSQTPAIADFGFTLAVGTGLTLVLAALFFSSAEKEV